VVTADARGRALEEQLGALGAVDLVVERLGARGLLHARDAAALVRHPGGPDLLQVQRRQQVRNGGARGRGHDLGGLQRGCTAPALEQRADRALQLKQ